MPTKTSPRHLHPVTVHSVKRLTNTRDGGPRFMFATDKGKFLTQADTSAAYNVENDFMGRNPLTDVTLVTTKAGKVWDWEPGNTRPATVQHRRPEDAPNAYTARAVCTCGYQGNWTSPGHADDLAAAHNCDR